MKIFAKCAFTAAPKSLEARWGDDRRLSDDYQIETVFLNFFSF
jgi:hypothetical protein